MQLPSFEVLLTTNTPVIQKHTSRHCDSHPFPLDITRLGQLQLFQISRANPFCLDSVLEKKKSTWQYNKYTCRGYCETSCEKGTSCNMPWWRELSLRTRGKWPEGAPHPVWHSWQDGRSALTFCRVTKGSSVATFQLLPSIPLLKVVVCLVFLQKITTTTHCQWDPVEKVPSFE